jgi:hypothetical protein
MNKFIILLSLLCLSQSHGNGAFFAWGDKPIGFISPADNTTYDFTRHQTKNFNDKGILHALLKDHNDFRDHPKNDSFFETVLLKINETINNETHPLSYDLKRAIQRTFFKHYVYGKLPWDKNVNILDNLDINSETKEFNHQNMNIRNQPHTRQPQIVESFLQKALNSNKVLINYLTYTYNTPNPFTYTPNINPSDWSIYPMPINLGAYIAQLYGYNLIIWDENKEIPTLGLAHIWDASKPTRYLYRYKNNNGTETYDWLKPQDNHIQTLIDDLYKKIQYTLHQSKQNNAQTLLKWPHNQSYQNPKSTRRYQIANKPLISEFKNAQSTFTKYSFAIRNVPGLNNSCGFFSLLGDHPDFKNLPEAATWRNEVIKKLTTIIKDKNHPLYSDLRYTIRILSVMQSHPQPFKSEWDFQQKISDFYKESDDITSLQITYLNRYWGSKTSDLLDYNMIALQHEDHSFSTLQSLSALSLPACIARAYGYNVIVWGNYANTNLRFAGGHIWSFNHPTRHVYRGGDHFQTLYPFAESVKPLNDMLLYYMNPKPIDSTFF